MEKDNKEPMTDLKIDHLEALTALDAYDSNIYEKVLTSEIITASVKTPIDDS